MGLRCIVKSCNTKYTCLPKHVSLHRFTEDRALFHTWLKNCGISRNISKAARICSLHFQDKYLMLRAGRYYLRKSAVPELKLDNNVNQISPTCNKLQNLKHIAHPVLLPPVLNAQSTNINKSNFVLIDINTIKRKPIENNAKTQSKSDAMNSFSNFSINEMHSYCNVIKVEKDDNEISSKKMEVSVKEEIKLNVDKCISLLYNTSKNNKPHESTLEDCSKKSDNELLKKFQAYKKAYKKQKGLNLKQKEKILMLENNLEQTTLANKKLEERMDILNEVIQNLLKKREEKFNNNDSSED